MLCKRNSVVSQFYPLTHTRFFVISNLYAGPIVLTRLSVKVPGRCASRVGYLLCALMVWRRGVPRTNLCNPTIHGRFCLANSTLYLVLFFRNFFCVNLLCPWAFRSVCFWLIIWFYFLPYHYIVFSHLPCRCLILLLFVRLLSSLFTPILVTIA